MRLLLTLVLAFFFALGTQAQSEIGKWKTIDDETGKPKSLVEIFKKGDKIYGKILKLYRGPDEDPDPICDDCDEDDDRYNKKVIGMEIIRDMEKDGDEWEDGTILDPKNGKVYDCKLWVDEDDPNKLQVRGYIAFFFRTQTWIRMN
jgi:uncharacterized protein (DUF2147 family)